MSFSGIETFKGIDVSTHGKYHVDLDNHPLREGKAGYDKTASFTEILQIALENHANIILKPSPTRKWYIKNIPLEIFENMRINNFPNRRWRKDVYDGKLWYITY